MWEGPIMTDMIEPSSAELARLQELVSLYEENKRLKKKNDKLKKKLKKATIQDEPDGL